MQEGSPIIDADEHDHEHANASSVANGNDVHWNGRHKGASSFVTRNNSVPAKKFKLQTKIVIGGEAAAASASVPTDVNRNQFDDEDSFDAMMTDDAEHYNDLNLQPVHHQNSNNFTHHQQHAPYHNEYPSSQQHEPNVTNHIHHMPSPTTSPLVVIDGANLAYNYAETLNPSISNQYQRREPNPRGITKAIQYFLQRQCRVQAVVPISWYKLKPRPGDHACAGGYKGNLNQRDDAKMLTDEVEELRTLRQHGFLVACPPGDDDDAYVIALARQEDGRSSQQNIVDEDGMMMDDEEHVSCLPLGGFVVSNDFYHDAVRRDQKKLKNHNSHLEEQHMTSLRQQSSSKHSLKAWLKHRRISYSFANVGLVPDVELEFLPNPRNELIEAIDVHSRSNQRNHHC